MRIHFFCITPSPYQRDTLSALYQHPDLEITISYFESAPDDSPWHAPVLHNYESILRGFSLGRGRTRCHVNFGLAVPDGCDLVVVNAPITALSTQWLLWRSNARGHPPVVFWGELLRQHTGWKLKIQNLLTASLRNVDAIVSIGTRASASYRQRIPSALHYNLPYSCNIDSFVECAKKRNTAALSCRFLMAGQMIARKGIDVLLSAFSQLIDNGLDVSLTLVGRQADLTTFLAPLPKPVRDRIDYLGFLQPDELPPIFAQADVFVLPSRHDGWGVVINQALGSGMPVISTTAVGASIDLLEPGVTGFIVPPADVEALASAMDRLATNPTSIVEMGRSARDKARKLTPSHAAIEWNKIFQEVIAQSTAE